VLATPTVTFDCRRREGDEDEEKTSETMDVKEMKPT